MVIENSTSKKIVLFLFKDFSRTHTVTSLAKEFKISRVGIWKILKKLQSKQFVTLTSIGSGKTNTFTAHLNWKNVLVKKSLALYLTEEALKQHRWRVNFAELEEEVEFLILYGGILYPSHKTNDIDIINIVSQKRKFVKIQNILDKLQKSQIKKIHAINFTEAEFKQELTKLNKAFVDAVKKGVVLFNQEKFIEFMRRVYEK